jgi:hypothetical protein
MGTQAKIDASESVEKLAPVERRQVGGRYIYRRCLRCSVCTLPFKSCVGDCKLGVDVAGGVKAEVSYLHEGEWQDMEEKSAHEFQRRELADFVVAGPEDDVVVIDVEDAMVGNGDPVSVEAEVTEERIWLLEGCLGEDDPFLRVEGALEPSEGGGFEQVGDALRGARRDGELALVEEPGETVEILAAK